MLFDRLAFGMPSTGKLTEEFVTWLFEKLHLPFDAAFALPSDAIAAPWEHV